MIVISQCMQKEKKKRKDLKSKEDNKQPVHARGKKKGMIYLTQILPKPLLFGIWDCNGGSSLSQFSM